MNEKDITRIIEMYMEQYKDGGFTDSESARSSITYIVITTLRLERGEIRWSEK